MRDGRKDVGDRADDGCWTVRWRGTRARGISEGYHPGQRALAGASALPLDARYRTLARRDRGDRQPRHVDLRVERDAAGARLPGDSAEGARARAQAASLFEPDPARR